MGKPTQATLHDTLSDLATRVGLIHKTSDVRASMLVSSLSTLALQGRDAGIVQTVEAWAEYLQLAAKTLREEEETAILLAVPADRVIAKKLTFREYKLIHSRHLTVAFCYCGTTGHIHESDDCEDDGTPIYKCTYRDDYDLDVPYRCPCRFSTKLPVPNTGVIGLEAT